MKLRNIVLIIVMVFVSLGCEKTEKDTIKVGVILPLTGDAAGYGMSAKKGVDLAIKEMGNKEDPSNIDFVYEDSQGDPRIGVTAFNKLKDLGGVQAVIGDLFSSVTLAFAPIANNSGIVVLSPASSSPEITKAGDYIFRNCPSDIYEGSIMANYAYGKLRYKKIGILYINNDYGIGIKNVFKKVFESNGGEIPIEEGYAQDNKNFRTALMKINTLNPDAIYLVGHKEMGNVLKQAKELNISTQFLSTVTFEDPEILSIAGDAADGVLYTASKFSVNSNDSTISKFVKSFRDMYNSDPDIFSVLSYDAAKIILTVLYEKSDLTLKNKLYGLSNYNSLLGKISFDKNGDVVLEPTIKIVKNGKFLFN